MYPVGFDALKNDRHTHSHREPRVITHVAFGMALGVSAMATYIFAVVGLGIGSRLFTGSAWLNSMIASMPTSFQLLAISMLYVFYGVVAGGIVGTVVYAWKRIAFKITRNE